MVISFVRITNKGLALNLSFVLSVVMSIMSVYGIVLAMDIYISAIALLWDKLALGTVRQKIVLSN